MLPAKQAQQTIRTYLYVLTALRPPLRRLKMMSVRERPISHNVKKIQVGSEERREQGFVYFGDFLVSFPLQAKAVLSLPPTSSAQKLPHTSSHSISNYSHRPGDSTSTPLCPLSVPSSSTPLPTSQLEGHHYDSKAETGFTCSPLSVLLPRPMGRLHFPDFLVITSRPGDVDCGQKLYIRFSVLAIKLPNNCPYSLFPFHSNHAGHGLKMAA